MDAIYFSGLMNAETGEQINTLIEQTINENPAVLLIDIDVTHLDPTLATFHEPKVEVDAEDEEHD